MYNGSFTDKLKLLFKLHIPPGKSLTIFNDVRELILVFWGFFWVFFESKAESKQGSDRGRES